MATSSPAKAGAIYRPAAALRCAARLRSRNVPMPFPNWLRSSRSAGCGVRSPLDGMNIQVIRKVVSAIGKSDLATVKRLLKAHPELFKLEPAEEYGWPVLHCCLAKSADEL